MPQTLDREPQMLQPEQFHGGLDAYLRQPGRGRRVETQPVATNPISRRWGNLSRKTSFFWALSLGLTVACGNGAPVLAGSAHAAEISGDLGARIGSEDKSDSGKSSVVSDAVVEAPINPSKDNDWQTTPADEKEKLAAMESRLSALGALDEVREAAASLVTYTGKDPEKFHPKFDLPLDSRSELAVQVTNEAGELHLTARELIEAIGMWNTESANSDFLPEDHTPEDEKVLMTNIIRTILNKRPKIERHQGDVYLEGQRAETCDQYLELVNQANPALKAWVENRTKRTFKKEEFECQVVTGAEIMQKHGDSFKMVAMIDTDIPTKNNPLRDWFVQLWNQATQGQRLDASEKYFQLRNKVIDDEWWARLLCGNPMFKEQPKPKPSVTPAPRKTVTPPTATVPPTVVPPTEVPPTETVPSPTSTPESKLPVKYAFCYNGKEGVMMDLITAANISRSAPIYFPGPYTYEELFRVLKEWTCKPATPTVTTPPSPTATTPKPTASPTATQPGQPSTNEQGGGGQPGPTNTPQSPTNTPVPATNTASPVPPTATTATTFSTPTAAPAEPTKAVPTATVASFPTSTATTAPTFATPSPAPAEPTRALSTATVAAFPGTSFAVPTSASSSSSVHTGTAPTAVATSASSVSVATVGGMFTPTAAH